MAVNRFSREGVMKTWLVLSILLASAPPALAAPPARYDIKADIDLDRNTIRGNETLSFINTTTGPLDDIYLFLYPNRFQSIDPAIDEMNYRWHYPSGFDPAWLKIEHAQGAGGEPLEGGLMEPGLHESSGPPPGIVYHVRLSQALAPGTETSIRITFTTKLPFRFGPFGHYRETMTAQGGWYPYLVPLTSTGQPLFDGLPQRSSFRVQLSLNRARDVVVNGTFFEHASRIELSPQDALYVSFVLASRFHATTREVGSRSVVFYSLSKHRYELDQIMEVLSEAATEVPDFFSLDDPRPVVAVETYLRAVMTFPGERMVLVSDRFFKTVHQFDMRNLNRLEAARAVAQLFTADIAAARERPADDNWVAEALARAFRNHSMQVHFAKLSNLRETANSMGMWRPFNRMAESPTIPFSETYVASSGLDRDLLRESLLYFNNHVPSGHLFGDKLEATLGPETYDRIALEYPHQPRDFQALASEVSGQDLAWFFDQWKQGYPPDLDYRLANVERNVTSGEEYLTRFRVQKVTSRPFVDPVEVRVTRDRALPDDLMWNGQGSSKLFQVRTPSRVKAIEIDPRRRTVQTDDFNDIAPHPMQMVVDRGDVDVGARFAAGMRIRIHQLRDQGRWLFALPFFSPAEVGIESGMLWDFGGTVHGLVWNRKQEVSLSYGWTNLRSGLVEPVSGRVSAQGHNAGIRMRYTFANKMFEEDPMDFDKVELSGGLFRKELGSDFNFVQLQASVAKAVAPHPRHKLAAIAYTGYSTAWSRGDIVPAQKLFDMGAIVNRTVELGRHLGENILGGSVEWRHDLMPDVDVPMPMNMRIRRLQGVLAVDTGTIAPRYDDLFQRDAVIVGLRYGLRFHYDFIGVRPSNFTVDFGHRIRGPRGVSDDGLIISVGILQRF